MRRDFWSAVLSTSTVMPTLARSSATTLWNRAHCSPWAPGGVSHRICQSPCTDFTAPCAKAWEGSAAIASAAKHAHPKTPHRQAQAATNDATGPAHAELFHRGIGVESRERTAVWCETVMVPYSDLPRPAEPV